MGDYIILMGSEDVQRAGYQIKQAAEQIERAANQIERSLERFIGRLDETLAVLRGNDE